MQEHDSGRAGGPGGNAAMVADGMLGVQDAVEFSRLSRAEIYNLMGRGELAFLKHGKRRLIPRRALVELLAQRLAATQG